MSDRKTTAEEPRATILRLLHQLAPEADLAALNASAPLREELEIDSMDLLNLVIAIDRELGVSIPETDYAKVATLDALVAYVGERAGRQG